MSPSLCSSKMRTPAWTGMVLSKVRVYSSRPSAAQANSSATSSGLILLITGQYLLKRLLLLPVKVGKVVLQTDVKTVLI